MDSFEAASRIECNLYSENIRARISAMPLLLEELKDSDRPVVLVTSIEVETKHRSKGFGSRLLREACAIADREHIVLFLSVEPDGSEGSLSAEDLFEWYSRYGFDPYQDDEYSRIRPPC